MELYKTLYFHLFNAMTDAVEQLKACNYGMAQSILMQAQEDAENRYLDAENSEHESEPAQVSPERG